MLWLLVQTPLWLSCGRNQTTPVPKLLKLCLGYTNPSVSLCQLKKHGRRRAPREMINQEITCSAVPPGVDTRSIHRLASHCIDEEPTRFPEQRGIPETAMNQRPPIQHS